jgi:hypothetical protein
LQGEIVAVHLRHVQIRQQQCIVAALPALEGFATGRRNIRRVTEQIQLLANDFLIDLVIFSHQNQPVLP